MNLEINELKHEVDTLRRQVQRLNDEREIRDLIITYARGCDRGNDPEIIGPLFAERSTWESKGFGRYEGRDVIAAALKGIAGEKIWWSLHYMIGIHVDVGAEGSDGKLQCYLWETATIPNSKTGDAEAHFVGATYDCDVEKVDGKWLFTRMELILNMASPYAEGWVRKRYPDGTKLQPYFVSLEPGKYHWCSCGRSANQPFCDGSHKATSRVPIEFEVAVPSDVVLCGCKMSKTGHLCDGSHLGLKLPASDSPSANLRP